MKLKKRLSLLLVLMLLMSLIAGCGGATKGTVSQAIRPEEAPAMMADNAAGNALTGSSPSGSAAIPENRKWIITVHMSAETEDLDALTAALDETITSLKGYVEDQNIYNGSVYSSRRYRSASMTVRIPAETVDLFTEQVSGIANVISREKNLEDITLNYVSTESRLTALQTEETRLLELMEKAETMSDLLEIEARLTDVRYELESVASRLRTYDNQINYATIYLNISEVQEYTPVEDPTFFQRIKTTFSGSLKGLGEGIVDLTVFLVGNSPYLLTWGILIFLIVRLIKRRGFSFKFRKRDKKSDKT